MSIKAVDTYPPAIQFVPDLYKTQEMCFKALILVFLYLIIFLIDIKLKKCVIKYFPKILLCYNIVLIDIRIVLIYRCVIKLLMSFYQHDSFFLIDLLQLRWLKKLDDDYSLMMIQSLLMKILIISHVLVMKWYS